jgi:hypothetical protein
MLRFSKFFILMLLLSPAMGFAAEVPSLHRHCLWRCGALWKARFATRTTRSGVIGLGSERTRTTV